MCCIKCKKHPVWVVVGKTSLHAPIMDFSKSNVIVSELTEGYRTLICRKRVMYVSWDFSGNKANKSGTDVFSFNPCGVY